MKDLSSQDRHALIQQALSALAAGRLDGAAGVLAAAIRKAERAGIRDVEAEYLRLVMLYLSGRYDEAVDAAAACLEALHAIERDPARGPVADLPLLAVRRVVERAMLQAMVRRGDSVAAITRHLWSPTEGKVYAGKRGRPLPQAIQEAWAATHERFEFGIDTIRTELKSFAAVVEARYAERGETGRKTAPRAEGPADRALEAGGDTGANDEAETAGLLDAIVRRETWAVSEAEMERILAACARTVRPDNVTRIARIFNAAPAKASRRILGGLQKNRALAQAVAEGRFEAAPPEVVRFLHLTFGTPRRRSLTSDKDSYVQCATRR